MGIKGNDFIGGLLLGSVIGAALGLLFAPQSGEETRESIREYTGEITDKVKENSRHLIESSRDLLEQGKSHVSGLMKHCCVEPEGASEPEASNG